MTAKAARLWPDSATILERSKGVFFAQWEELLRLKRLAMKTSDPDDIHDLRVASRRFRAALELFYPLVPKGPKTELRKNVRNLTRSLGGLRNVDEALVFFQSRVPINVSSDCKLTFELSELRSRELKRIEKALKTFQHKHLDQIVRKMVAGINEASITEQKSISLLAYFSDVSIRQYMPIHQLLAGSTVPEHRASRHALRIAIKKWRYFFEIVARILNRDYTPVLAQLKEYQSILGRMNDIAEFEVLLNNLKLPLAELKYFEDTLLAEDTNLLKSFTQLLEQKPLTYTFLI